MAKDKKLQDGATLFARIELTDLEFLRTVARAEQCTIAEIVRDAIAAYREERNAEIVRMCGKVERELEKVRPALMRAVKRSKKRK